MVRVDDRTPDQEKTHKYLIVGTDSFMSGWGQAKDGNSYAAWAATQQDINNCEAYVESRKEMKRVRFVIDTPGARYRPRPDCCAHLHIYIYRGQK